MIYYHLILLVGFPPLLSLFTTAHSFCSIEEILLFLKYSF